MSAASEALADVRGWLCDNLSEGDAGKVCGMLSVVSRHIVALEDENAKLQKERDYLLANESPTACEVRRVRSAMKDVNDKNAKLREQGARLFDKTLELGTENDKLRELLHDAAIELYVNGNITDGATELLFDQMRELGIEAPHD